MAKKFINEKEALKIIQLWEDNTISEIADKMGVKEVTILSWGKDINKVNPKVCKAKERTRKKRKDIIAEALKMFKEESK